MNSGFMIHMKPVRMIHIHGQCLMCRVHCIALLQTASRCVLHTVYTVINDDKQIHNITTPSVY